LTVKLGILGGSFDPLHRGHLFMAALAAEEAGLDEVLFVPAATPPHKSPGALSPVEHRLAMLEIALASEPRFAVSSIELAEGGPRYTVDTILAFSRERPGDELSFLLGMDSLLELPTWRDPERILRSVRVVAVNRPGFDAARVDAHLRNRVLVVEGNPLAISASGVRDRVARGLSIRHLVPDGVERYIEEHRLYRAGARRP
jgi:nicotinate-nucleotide adenylyltransferase